MFSTSGTLSRPSETDYSAFRPQHSAHPVQDGIVQPYADSPLDEEPVAETVYLNLLAGPSSMCISTRPIWLWAKRCWMR